MNNTNAEIQCYVEELSVDLDDTAYFKIPGEKGDPGTPGKDGHSPVVTATKSGKTTTISVDGAAIATVEDGAVGPQGPAGAPGKTPVRGTDYWTAADKQEIVNNVLAALPDGTEVAY